MNTVVRVCSFTLALVFGVGGFGQMLTPGQPVNAALDPKSQHVYTFPVRAGEYVSVTATPRGADIALLLSSGATDIIKIDRLKAEGSENIFWIAPAPADLRLTISAKATAVSYQLLAEVREPSPRDRACAAAFAKTWIEVEAKLAGTQGPEIPAKLVRPLLAIEESAMPEWDVCGDPSWKAYARYKLSTVYYRLANMEKAKDLLLEAIALLRPLQQPFELSGALNNAGFYLARLDRDREAIAFYGEVAELRRRAGDLVGLSNTLNNLGMSYANLSELGKAEDYLRQAADLRLRTGNRPGLAVTLSNLAMLNRQQNNYQSALDSSLQALRIRTELGDKLGQANSYNGIGATYSEMGDVRHARDYYERALLLYQEVADRLGTSSAYSNLGSVKLRQGNPREALEDLERALALRREIKAPAGIANTLNVMCRAHLALNQLDRAREACREAVELARRSQDQRALGTALLVTARVLQAAGDLEASAETARESLAAFTRAGNREDQTMSLTALAAVERDRGRLSEALLAVEEATRLSDLSRRAVPNAALRATYRSQRADAINLLTDVLMRLHAQDAKAGYDLRAFAVAEQYRARSLVEMIGGAARRTELTPDLRRQQDQLLAAISKAQQELLREQVAPGRQAQLKSELRKAEAEFDLLEISQPGQADALAAAPKFHPADAASFLKPGEAVLLYAMAEPRSYAWLVTSSGIHSSNLPGKDAVRTAVEQYRRSVTQRVTALTLHSAMAATQAESARLYSLLVKPFEAHLDAVQTLVVVPDGVLSYVPFETLASPQLLIERFRIGYAPSLSSVVALRERQKARHAAPRSLLALADPAYPETRQPSSAAAPYVERGLALTRLPNTRREVLSIQALFNNARPQVLVGADASEQSLKHEDLSQYRYLHLAAHGYLDEEQPSRSGILLFEASGSKEDGILQMGEIARLRLNADLVTLSACQSGLGEILDGEGVMGLGRAFFHAGAQGLVVSLWNVNDAATAELMQQFYRHLKAGVGQVEALRRAKLSLLKMPGSPWRHPYFWAPFISMGDWR